MRKTNKGNSLKKYIINEQMLNTLQNLPMSRALAEELDELKPIEPMEESTMLGIAATADACTPGKPLITMLRGQIIVSDFQKRLLVLLRAIEAHIAGSEQ